MTMRCDYRPVVGYSPEFTEEAARMAADSSRPISAVARELEMENAFLKIRGILRQGAPVTGTFDFIEAEHAAPATGMAPAPTVSQMCGRPKVSRPGFYGWQEAGRPRT
jgi:hypothetical protein